MDLDSAAKRKTAALFFARRARGSAGEFIAGVCYFIGLITMNPTVISNIVRSHDIGNA